MASPAVWDEDFNCYVHGEGVAAVSDGVTQDAEARTALNLALVAAARARIIGRDPVDTRDIVIATTNGDATITGTAVFDAADVGASISGTGIPAGAGIISVANDGEAEMSVAATATSTPTIAATVNRNPATPQTSASTIWDASHGRYTKVIEIAAPAGGATVDTQARTAIGQILVALRGGGHVASTTNPLPTVYDATGQCYTFSAYTAPAGGGTIDAESRTAIASLAAALQSAGLLRH